MLYFKNNFAYVTLFSIFGFTRCLIELPALEDDDIAITEVAIRNTVNNLFATFQIKDEGHQPRLKKLSMMYNSFTILTLKYCNHLKKVVRLSRDINLDKNNQYFMTQINELLNKGDKNIEVQNDSHVNTYAGKLIDRLRDLKRTYKKKTSDIKIHASNLEHSDVNISAVGSTKNYCVNDDAVWKPSSTSGRRIFQGHRTRIKHYPFMASVQFFLKFQCSGSIIQKDLVITAASCLQLAWNNRFFRENPAFLSVQVGSDFYEASGDNIPVLEIYFHPEYSPKTLNNNLAVMRLTRYIHFSRKHKRVKMIEVDQVASPLAINTDGIGIVGWGAKDQTNIVKDPWVNRLTYANLDYYSRMDCQDVYSKEYVTDKHFCAGFLSKGGGACAHDIGGPGISHGILVGVISFGPPTCGTPDAPTVFTKLGYYNDWIENIMESPVPVARQLSTLYVPKTIGTRYEHRTTKRFHIEPFMEEEAKFTNTSSYLRTPSPQKPTIVVNVNDFNNINLTIKVESDKDTITEFTENNDDIRNKILRGGEKEIIDQNDNKNTIKYVVESAGVNNISSKYNVSEGTDFIGSKDSELEKDIVYLLDDLDLHKLLESEELEQNDDAYIKEAELETGEEYYLSEVDVQTVNKYTNNVEQTQVQNSSQNDMSNTLTTMTLTSTMTLYEVTTVRVDEEAKPTRGNDDNITTGIDPIAYGITPIENQVINKKEFSDYMEIDEKTNSRNNQTTSDSSEESGLAIE